MTAMASRRLFILGILIWGTFGWVGLMSIQFGAAALGPGRSAPFAEDGSVKANVASLDNQNFEITLSMRVTRPDGKVIGGLSQQDFEVREDGNVVGIKKFVTAGQQSVRACLVIDCSGSMDDPVNRQAGAGSRIRAAQIASNEFLDLMRDGTDHVGIYYFNSSKIECALAVDQLDSGRRTKAKQVIGGLKAGGGTPLYNAMETALEGMKGVTGRRILVVLTDGMDDHFQAATEQKNRIIERAKALNIPLIMIALGDLAEIDQPGMQKFADETRGQYLYTPTAEALRNFYHTLGQTLQDEYALTYDSPYPQHDGLARKVEVVVRNGSSGARATTEYKVAGVLSSGASGSRKPVSGGPPSPETGASLGSVFFPLFAVLGLLFGVPYARSVWPRSTDSSPSVRAAALPVATIVTAPPPRPTPVQVAPAVHARALGADAPQPGWKPPTSLPLPSEPVSPGNAAAATPPAGEHVCPHCHRPAAAASTGKHYCLICERRF